MVPISEKSYGKDFRIQRWNHNPASNVALGYCKIYGNKKQFKTSTWMLISNSKLYCKILLPAALSAMCTPNVWNFYVHGSLICKVKCIDKYSDPMGNVSIVCSEMRKTILYWIETKLVISVYHDTSLYPQNTGKCWRWERERKQSSILFASCTLYDMSWQYPNLLQPGFQRHEGHVSSKMHWPLPNTKVPMQQTHLRTGFDNRSKWDHQKNIKKLRIPFRHLCLQVMHKCNVWCIIFKMYCTHLVNVSLYHTHIALS